MALYCNRNDVDFLLQLQIYSKDKSSVVRLVASLGVHVDLLRYYIPSLEAQAYSRLDHHGIM